MTRPELWWGSGALIVGVIVGALLFRRRTVPAPTPPVVTESRDAGESDDAQADAMPDALEGDAEAFDATLLDAEEIPRPIPEPVHRRRRDGGADASPKGAAVVLRESNLLIRPVGSDQLCVDASHTLALHLFTCHGRKNQRWTFAEDINATSRISDGEGSCIRVGAPGGDGEPRFDVGACGAGVARFRLGEGHRLVEAHSGQCMSVRRVEKRAEVVLEACNPSSTGQAWSLSR